MPPGDLRDEAVREQLERVLASPGFSRNERLSRFLQFVVERHLEGRDSELKESLIAVEVFGRNPGYDPKEDAIVRTEAMRLRERLGKYYAGEGRGDPVIIELPKGGYTPVFRQPVAHPGLGNKRRIWFTAALVGLAAVLAAGWWWVRQRSEPVVIAVLPLDNLSRDPGEDYFADGLTDEIIRNLS